LFNGFYIRNPFPLIFNTPHGLGRDLHLFGTILVCLILGGWDYTSIHGVLYPFLGCALWD